MNGCVYRSWKSIFARLTSPIPPSPATTFSLTAFLTSPTSIDSLASCHTPFPPSSPASKADFEKRTAPINFTAADQPVASGPGNELPGIAELKDAALELSKSLDIDEVGALRIVVLEYQSRPGASLISADASSGEGAQGSFVTENTLRASELVSGEEKKENVFLSRVSVYMSERRYIIKTAAFLVRAAICADRKDNIWREVGRRFAVEGIVEKGGLAGKVVDAIGQRWNEGRKGGEGLPVWVMSRLEGGSAHPIAYKWEQQVYFNPEFDGLSPSKDRD